MDFSLSRKCILLCSGVTVAFYGSQKKKKKKLIKTVTNFQMLLHFAKELK